MSIAGAFISIWHGQLYLVGHQSDPYILMIVRHKFSISFSFSWNRWPWGVSLTGIYWGTRLIWSSVSLSAWCSSDTMFHLYIWWVTIIPYPSLSFLILPYPSLSFLILPPSLPSFLANVIPLPCICLNQLFCQPFAFLFSVFDI